MWLFLLACAPEAPDVCTTMCEAAESLYGDCLASWGAGWEAAAYEDGEAFLASCETWSLEMRQLEADAGKDGVVDETCATRGAAMMAEDAECTAFTEVEWSKVPWEK